MANPAQAVTELLLQFRGSPVWVDHVEDFIAELPRAAGAKTKEARLSKIDAAAVKFEKRRVALINAKVHVQKAATDLTSVIQKMKDVHARLAKVADELDAVKLP